MLHLIVVAQLAIVASDSSVRPSPTIVPFVVAAQGALASLPSDTTRTRPRAIEYSDAYYTRLTIHRWGSYAMLPLFGAEYILGNELLNGSHPSSWVKPTHTTVAIGLGALFGINTVTGLWNLWDSRHDANDRTRRYVHTVLMLAADAGLRGPVPWRSRTNRTTLRCDTGTWR